MMIIRKPSRFIRLVAVIHFLASVTVFFWLFSIGMRRFDSGVIHASVLERCLEGLSIGLNFPLVPLFARTILGKLLPGPLGWLTWIANSFVWAFAISWLVNGVITLRYLRSKTR